MILHPLDLFFIVVSVLAEAILALVILRKDAARRWPFLLALALFDLLHGVLMASYLSNYHSYFYIYWYGHGVRSLLTLGLLRDVLRAFPELKYVPKRVGLMLLSAGLTVTIGSVLLTTLHHPHTTYKITYEVLMIRECVTVLWVCCAGTLLASISFLGLGWSFESVKITSGFLIMGVAAMLAASLTSSWPSHGHVIDKLQTCTEIAVFLSWIKTLISLPDALLSDSALHVVNELL